MSCGGEFLHRRIYTLMKKVWSSTVVPSDWRDAQIVPILKNGDLRSCDNWRDISLLDMLGKLCVCIVQDRLEQLDDDLLPESQCGFRKGRGCVDMIFAACQLIEKAIGHQSELCILLTDLRRLSASLHIVGGSGAFCCAAPMLSIIRSLHECMLAHVRVGGGASNTFGVNNGLWQGCTLAPMLFINLYFAAVVLH